MTGTLAVWLLIVNYTPGTAAHAGPVFLHKGTCMAQAQLMAEQARPGKRR